MNTVNKTMEPIKEVASPSASRQNSDDDNKRNSQFPRKVYSDDLMNVWYQFESKLYLPGNYHLHFCLDSGAMAQTVSQYVSYLL